MLTSALSKENDSVFVDLLTYSDLELLKARKTGSMSLANNSNSSTSSLSRSKEKRYIILTYTSEFDRVHYPLPLSPQKEPDVESLKRMIRRLRAALHDKKSGEQVKDDKCVVVIVIYSYILNLN
jgi:coiled-coil domain-containing protein 61